MYHLGQEVVRGTIIGGEGWYYEFWQTKDHPECKPPFCFKPGRIDRGHFANDEEAEAYVKQYHPTEYRFGVEMRCFDK